MSRRGNGYDNARAEAFYNLRRRHSFIGYLAPVDFENQKN